GLLSFCELGLRGGVVDRDWFVSFSFATDPAIWFGSISFSQSQPFICCNDTLRVIGQVQHVATGFPGDAPVGDLVTFTVEDTDPEHNGEITHKTSFSAPQGDNFDLYTATLITREKKGFFVDSLEGWTFKLSGFEIEGSVLRRAEEEANETILRLLDLTSFAQLIGPLPPAPGQVIAVPEPGTFLLVAVGVAALGGAWRRAHRQDRRD